MTTNGPPPPGPAPRELPAWAPTLGASLVVLVVLTILSAASARGALWMRETRRLFDDERGAPAAVLRTWEGQQGKNIHGFAELRFDDGTVGTARVDKEQLARVAVGERMRAWRTPDGESHLEESVRRTRRQAHALELVFFVASPLLLVWGALIVLATLRSRRLFARGTAAAAEIVAVERYRVRYRYRTPSGEDVEGSTRATPDRFAMMGPKPRLGLAAWIVYAPENPASSVLWSLRERVDLASHASAVVRHQLRSGERDSKVS